MFDLPPLPYEYNSLEPYIDTETMKIHHLKHHQGYVTKLNDALKELHVDETCAVKICKHISKYNIAVRNNAGGHLNHTMFFSTMAPHNKGGGGNPSTKFSDILKKAFGSVDKFKELFSQAAANRFGSGWAWLCVDNNKKLFICSTANQDNPLMDIPENKDQKGIPILGIDVWEHAYYLKYQNKRPDYIQAFWNIVNWKKVEERYNKALELKVIEGK